MLANQLTRFTFVIGQGQKKQFASNVLVLALEAFFFSRLDQTHQLAPHLHLILALNLGVPCHHLLGVLQQGRHRHTRAHQQGLGTIGLAQHRNQQVGRFNIGLVGTQHQGLGIGQSFLKLGGELFDSHSYSRHCCDELHFGLPRLFSSGAKVKQAPRA